MSNSSLVSYKKISPNRTSPRNHEIDTVSIHCVVGQVHVESLGSWFAKSSTQASSNYGIGKDGRIGMYVEEKDRSWCTSNRANDNRAITIEVASDTKHPYAVTTKAYNALIDLLVDICKRNPGIKRLRWKADPKLIGQVDKQNMTVHRWFANKSCPGDYLFSRHAQIAAEVNKRLDAEGSEAAVETEEIYRVRKSWDDAKSQLGAYKVLKNAKAKADANPGYKVFNSKGEVVYDPAAGEAKEAFQPYLVRIKVKDLYIRKGPGTNYKTNGFIKPGVYTIVEEASGKGSVKGWGKLKSGAGYISLDYCTKP